MLWCVSNCCNTKKKCLLIVDKYVNRIDVLTASACTPMAASLSLSVCVQIISLTIVFIFIFFRVCAVSFI